MATNSMAHELLHFLSLYNYTERILYLTIKDVFAQKLFALTELSDTHWLDTHKCYGQRRKNSQQLLDIFAAFCDEEPNQVHTEMIKHINQERDCYMRVGVNHLKWIKLTIDEWLRLMSSESVFTDELMLYALS